MPRGASGHRVRVTRLPLQVGWRETEADAPSLGGAGVAAYALEYGARSMSGSASGRRWMTIVLASVLVAGLALGVRLLWFSEPGRPARGATAPATEREDLTPEVRGSVVDGEGRPVRG